MGRFDAIIVGASYAGLAAATQMPGRRLLVLERHDSIVARRRGSLGLLLPVGESVEVRGNDLFLKGMDLFVENGVRQKFVRLRLRGLAENLDFYPRKSLVLVNEGRVKGALLRRVKELGGEVVIGSTVRSIDTDGREARARTDQEHVARVLIGADGVGSVVSRSLGIRREKISILFQREVELSKLDIPDETLFVQFDDARNFFLAHAIGDGYRASVIQVIGPHDVPDDLESRLEDKVERFGAGRLLDGRGAVVRLFQPATTTFRSNVIITGDALAAYGFATITGALAMGTLAGRSANRFLAGSHYALPDYHDNWKKVSGQKTIERLRLAMLLLGRIGGDRVDKILKAARGPGRRPGVNPNLTLRLPAILWSLFA
ncbi:MAG TPA: FAD-dependent monooxygenase [Myxococcota bacterium]|nr:FAD-dependent monooxygenase [Myxococcota bacterium]